MSRAALLLAHLFRLIFQVTQWQEPETTADGGIIAHLIEALDHHGMANDDTR